MKKIIPFLALIFYLAGLFYLTRPAPALPSLADSARSDEPGDTVQHPDQSAYYTNRNSRPGILGELQQKFGLPIFAQLSYRLNYRPEEAFAMVRDQLRAYYIEEVVHPLRESLFINVWEPTKSPLIESVDQGAQRMYLHNVYYPVKVTLRPVYSEVWTRLLVWTLIFPSIYAVFLSLKQSLAKQV